MVSLKYLLTFAFRVHFSYFALFKHVFVNPYKSYIEMGNFIKMYAHRVIKCIENSFHIVCINSADHAHEEESVNQRLGSEMSGLN